MPNQILLGSHSECSGHIQATHRHQLHVEFVRSTGFDDDDVSRDIALLVLLLLFYFRRYLVSFVFTLALVVYAEFYRFG